jgi:hypothetical protein
MYKICEINPWLMNVCGFCRKRPWHNGTETTCSYDNPRSRKLLYLVAFHKIAAACFAFITLLKTLSKFQLKLL